MFDGYPLRKFNWKDWLLIILTSTVVMQFILTFILTIITPAENFLLEGGEELFNQLIANGAIYGSLLSLPLTLFVVYYFKIPLFNRRQLSKKESFLIRGVSKEDWKFLLKYIPISYFIYLAGQVVLINFLEPSEPANQVAVESLFDYIPLWQMFLMIVIVAPITEEIIFRGILLFKGDELHTAWWRVLVSALLFGLIHGPTDFFSFYTYVGMGFIFAYASKRTQSLESAIIYHFLNNFVGFLQILALRELII